MIVDGDNPEPPRCDNGHNGAHFNKQGPELPDPQRNPRFYNTF